jgi:hypothetical protein
MNHDFLAGMVAGWALNLLFVVPTVLFAIRRIDS